MARTICVYMKCDPRTRACSWVILHVYTYAHMARTICVYMKCDPRTWSSEHSHIRQSYQVLFRWESNFTHELTHICHKRYVYTCNVTHELDHPNPRTHANCTTHFLVVTLISLTNSRTYVTNTTCIRVMWLTNSIIRKTNSWICNRLKSGLISPCIILQWPRFCFI